MRKIIIMTFLTLFVIDVKPQDSIIPNRNGLTITIPQPFGFILKDRIGVDYRLNNKSFGLTYTYYRLDHNTHEGDQIFANLRLYNKSKIYKPIRGEVFTQFKLGTGFKDRYRYDFIGIARGSRIYLDKKNHIILEPLWGIKIPFTYGDLDYFESLGLKGTFLLFGPGSIIDLNFNLGYRF
jgi:hypothetical protein